MESPFDSPMLDLQTEKKTRSSSPARFEQKTRSSGLLDCRRTRGDQTFAGHPDHYQPPSGVWILAVWDLDPNIGHVVANYDDLPLLEPSGCMSYYEPKAEVTRYPRSNMNK